MTLPQTTPTVVIIIPAAWTIVVELSTNVSLVTKLRLTARREAVLPFEGGRSGRVLVDIQAVLLRRQMSAGGQKSERSDFLLSFS